MAEAAAKATEDGRVKIHPESWAKPYLAWLHNNRDWCISRQIWWGHQIPVWYCLACGDYSEEKVRRIREDPDFKNESVKSLLRESAKRAHRSNGDPGQLPRLRGKDLVRDPGRAGHLVFFRPLAPDHPGLARRNRLAAVPLPHLRVGHGPRNSLPVGGPDGHDGA
jgi:hypothetical protein